MVQISQRLIIGFHAYVNGNNSDNSDKVYYRT
jgi:hypothetical protein